MARIARTYRVVRPDVSAAKRPNPSEEEIEAARILDYQQMYWEAEQAQATESNEDEAEVSKDQKESNEDEGLEDYS